MNEQKMKKLIKICGMREPSNIDDIAGLKPDFMGFIFYPASKRFAGNNFVMPHLPEGITKTGVFVNESEQTVIALMQKYKLDIAQLHGSETPEVCSRIQAAGFTVWKAFGIDGDFDWKTTEPYSEVTHGFVFDTRTSDHGGSGRKFNWDILQQYRLQHPFLLSGGIQPADGAAVREFEHPQCMGVDINSGFEVEPGLKDVQLVASFIHTIRRV